jgi:hypothetical protein
VADLLAWKLVTEAVWSVWTAVVSSGCQSVVSPGRLATLVHTGIVYTGTVFHTNNHNSTTALRCQSWLWVVLPLPVDWSGRTSRRVTSRRGRTGLQEGGRGQRLRFRRAHTSRTLHDTRPTGESPVLVRLPGDEWGLERGRQTSRWLPQEGSGRQEGFPEPDGVWYCLSMKTCPEPGCSVPPSDQRDGKQEGRCTYHRDRARSRPDSKPRAASRTEGALLEREQHGYV